MSDLSAIRIFCAWTDVMFCLLNPWYRRLFGVEFQACWLSTISTPILQFLCLLEICACNKCETLLKHPSIINVSIPNRSTVAFATSKLLYLRHCPCTHDYESYNYDIQGGVIHITNYFNKQQSWRQCSHGREALKCLIPSNPQVSNADPTFVSFQGYFSGYIWT